VLLSYQYDDGLLRYQHEYDVFFAARSEFLKFFAAASVFASWLCNFVQVQQEESMMSRVYNAYIYTLRLPLHLFFLIMLSSPVLLSVIFTGLYLLDLEGLYIPQDHQPHAESLHHHHQIHKTSTSLSLWEVLYVLCGGEDRFKIFIFSLSLSTTFGGTRVEARSPYTLLLANLNTLMAQLIFVFLSGAGGLQLSLSLSLSPQENYNIDFVCEL